MYTKIDEIAPDIFRLSTLVPDVAPRRVHVQPVPRPRRASRSCSTPACASSIPLVSDAVVEAHPDRGPAMDLLRPRRGRRVRGDEPVPRRRAEGRGRPRRTGLHGLAQRPRRPPAARHRRRRARPRRHRMRFVPTPHVPHNWESGLWFDETTSTLFAGDLFTHVGDVPALTSRRRRRAGARRPRTIFHATSLGPDLVPTLRRLADLRADDAGADARLVVHGRRRHPAAEPRCRVLGVAGRRRLMAPGRLVPRSGSRPTGNPRTEHRRPHGTHRTAHPAVRSRCAGAADPDDAARCRPDRPVPHVRSQHGDDHGHERVGRLRARPHDEPQQAATRDRDRSGHRRVVGASTSGAFISRSSPKPSGSRTARSGR